MKGAIRITAGAFGMVAGFSAIQHGFYEMLQGNVRPDSIMISSYGPPCQPEKVWHMCEPAMTVLSNYFWTGILSMIVGLVVMIWAAAFVQRKYGGVVLILLSVTQLLVGGGLIPPLIGIIAGVVGNKIDSPLPWWRAHLSRKGLRFLTAVWSWSLAAFVAWLFGQYPVGYFFNDSLQEYGHFSLLLIAGLLLLSCAGAFAHEVRSGERRAAA